MDAASRSTVAFPADRVRAAANASFSVVVIGGGAAGITVAAELRRHRPSLKVAIVEPSEVHCYQPGWTLVGAGVFKAAQTQRREETLIPSGVTWLRQKATTFYPDENVVALSDGTRLAYQQLVVCPGLQLDWSKVEGLTDSLGRNGVCSNYRIDSAAYTWECLKALKGGSAIFTQPAMPIKCAGAPQKIMYLAADHLRKSGLLGKTSIEFCLTGDVLFGVPFFVPPLQAAVDRYGIKVRYKHTLKAVDGPAKKAIFAVVGPDGALPDVVRSFDFLHVTPPQSAPDFVKASPLANGAGWVDVDPATLRHVRYGNIFSLGDAAGTANAKTAAAVRLQAPVVVNNLLAVIDGKSLPAAYDGYGSCPLTTAYGEVVLAEFLYGGKVAPSFPLDPRVPRSSMWLLKTKFLPFLYWSMMLKGSELDIKHRERNFARAA
jgi:sulfide:quinone oxidoreductase